MAEQLPSLKDEPWLKQRALQEVMAALASAGGEVRVAGGAIRNALMGEEVSEIDLATSLTPEEVMAVGASSGFGVHPTGLQHGTVTLAHHHQAYEVTTLRRDVETDGRHALVEFTSDWADDAARRDFTMNALYCDAQGKIYDYTNGYEDILKKKVRFVGEALTRIEEDYLRILRFFRFQARYGEGAADGPSLAACIAGRQGLRGLSAERIRQELLKLFVARGALATLALMKQSGILAEILPTTDDFSVLAHLPPEAILRLVAIAAEPEKLKERLRLSNAEGLRIEKILKAPVPHPEMSMMAQHQLLYQLGAETWRDVVLLAAARKGKGPDDPAWGDLLQLPERWPVPVFPLRGEDLLTLGGVPGKQLGADLASLEQRWIASDFTFSAMALKQIYQELLASRQP